MDKTNDVAEMSIICCYNNKDKLERYLLISLEHQSYRSYEATLWTTGPITSAPPLPC